MASRRRQKNITEQWETLGVPREFFETVASTFNSPEDFRGWAESAASLCNDVQTTAERLQSQLHHVSELLGEDWPEAKLIETANSDPSLCLPSPTCCNYATLIPALLLAVQSMHEQARTFLLRVKKSAADANQAQTRALVWLVLALQHKGTTRYRACYDVAEFLEQHSTAAPGGRALYERVNRFENDHFLEYQLINSFLNGGFPSGKNLKTMIALGLPYPMPVKSGAPQPN